MKGPGAVSCALSDESPIECRLGTLACPNGGPVYLTGIEKVGAVTFQHHDDVTGSSEAPDHIQSCLETRLRNAYYCYVVRIYA